MAPRKDAVRAQRPRAAAPRPLTEHQLAEVRRAVLALNGSGGHSVKVHGLVVYFDKELTLSKANPLTRSAYGLRRCRHRRPWVLRGRSGPTRN